MCAARHCRCVSAAASRCAVRRSVLSVWFEYPRCPRRVGSVGENHSEGNFNFSFDCGRAKSRCIVAFLGFFRMRGFELFGLWALTSGRLAIVAGVLFSGSDIAASAQDSSATRIHLSWSEFFDRTSPNPVNNVQLNKRLTLVLEGGSRISEKWNAAAGNESYRWKEGATLGQGWRVLSRNEISRTDHYPNHTVNLKVSLSGNSCTFAISFNLKPGARDFINPMLSQPGRAGRYSRYSAGFPQCRIE